MADDNRSDAGVPDGSSVPARTTSAPAPQDAGQQQPLPELAGYDLVLTPEEVAHLLRLNQQYLVRLMREGKFPGFKAAGQWRVRRSELQAVMEGTWMSDGDDDVD
jgi:excisionase family DNA binding protein